MEIYVFGVLIAIAGIAGVLALISFMKLYTKGNIYERKMLKKDLRGCYPYFAALFVLIVFASILYYF